MATPGRLLIALLLCAPGCVSRGYGAVSIVSTHPDAVKARILAEKVEGKDCHSGIFVLGDKLANYRAATQNAIASVPGADALVNASIDFEVENYFFYQEWCLRVTGSAAVFE